MTGKHDKPQGLIIVAAALTGAFVLAIFLSRDAVNKPVVYPARRAMAVAATRPDLPGPLHEAIVRVPKVLVEAIVLRQQGVASALLAIDAKAAKWYRRGDEIRPGFVITGIVRKQITVRQGDAYYEYALHK